MPPCMPARVIHIWFQCFLPTAEVGSRWGHAKHLCLFIRIIYLFLCTYLWNIYISQDTGGSGGSQSAHNSKTIKSGAGSLFMAAIWQSDWRQKMILSTERRAPFLRLSPKPFRAVFYGLYFNTASW